MWRKIWRMSSDHLPDGRVFAVKTEDIPEGADRGGKKYAVDVALYKACREYTGRDLAWGILTGVRPTKIAMQKQEQGMDEASFVEWFHEDSFVSPEKAALAWKIAGREKRIWSAWTTGTATASMWASPSALLCAATAPSAPDPLTTGGTLWRTILRR